MRTLRLVLAVLVTGALVGGAVGAVTAESEESEAMVFPTGMLVSVESNDMLLEFNEDGTGLVHAEGLVMPIIYATVGDLYTEMMFDHPTDPKVPATYYWDFDGDHLTTELWGVDYQPHRNFMYAENTLTPIDDPVAVVVAKRDIPAGEPVYARWTTLGFVAAAEASADALTHGPDVSGAVATVDIAKGQAITPDLLVPIE